MEIARQLMLIENIYLRNILTEELLSGKWRKKNKEQLAPNILAYINWFNRITTWIISEIVTGLTLKRRTKLIEKFIEIGDHSLSINNFNTLMEVASALNQGPIYRLKQSWSTISDKHKEMWDRINDIMSPECNYSNLRKRIKEWSTEETNNRLPYLGLFLQDLLAYEEIPSKTSEDLINFQKMRKITNTMKQIRSYQIPVDITVNETVRDFLISDELVLLDESAQFKYSRECESKNVQS